MTTGAGAGLGAVRSLAASAAGAEDGRLMRLVRLLDAVPERGEADRVLEAARPRLGVLRPARPLRFARLLFAPLDGAIAPVARWRRGGHELPRSALGPLAGAGAVAAALGPEAAAVRRDAEGRTSAEEDAVAALGTRLWRRAAEALPTRPPEGWAEAGLTVEDLAAVRAVAGPVLASGDAVFAAARAVEHDPGPTRARLRAALAPVAEAGPLPLAAALATLLRRAADPGGVAAAAAELGAGARAVAARMLEAALEETPPIEALDLRGAAERMAQFLGRAESMARCGLLGPEGVRRLLGRQREAAEACRRRLAAGAETQVIAPLTALAEAAEVTDGAVAEVEAAARGLRVVARAGRGAGDPAAHDRALRALADGVAALRHRAVRPGGLTPMDLARAVEILAGPEAAEALLRGAAGPPG